MSTAMNWLATQLQRAERLARRTRMRLEQMVRGHPVGETLFRHILTALRHTRNHRLSNAKADRRRRLVKAFKRFLASPEVIALPTSSTPRVSVVLVLWNQAALTLDCLRGVAKQAGVTWELIIVDNGSTDATETLLARVAGAQVIVNRDNRGFLLAANQGVAAARGEFVVLLNNDAHLHDDGLRAAFELIAADATIGAVGGRVILPDGTLQEAGSIIWNDGTCVGYARGMAPDAGEAMFRRDVDYCSGVFLMFRRAIFEGFGGFDTRFAPAYYEDSDFCMHLWQQGLRVVYEPSVTLDHLEYGSATGDASVMVHLNRMRHVFRAKWSSQLQQHLPSDTRNQLVARTRTKHANRVLVLDDRVPVVTHGAGFPRAQRFIETLASNNRFVTFVPCQSPHEAWDVTWQTLPRHVEVLMGHGVAGIERLLSERIGYYDTLFVNRPHNMAVVARLHASHPELFEGMRILHGFDTHASATDDECAITEAINHHFDMP